MKANQLKTKSGFTLAELLVVMAVTVILLGLVFGPLIEAFHLTNRSQMMVAVQDAGRQAVERINQQLGNAAYVFDNQNMPINLWVNNQSGVETAVPLSNAWVDMVSSLHVNDQNPNEPIDPTTGLPADTANTGNFRGPLSLPLVPGRIITRIFIGLRNNLSVNNKPVFPYANRYDDPRTSITQDNPCALYEADFMPYNPDGTMNTKLMDPALDPSGNSNIQVILDNPNFFYDSNVVGSGNPATEAMPGWKDLNGDGKVEYFENWAAIASPLVAPDRSDAISLKRDSQHNIIYDSNGLPLITPLFQLAPKYQANDQMVPTSNTDPNDEEPSITPDSVTASYGGWDNQYQVYVFRSNLNAPVLNYFVGDGSGQITEYTYNTTTGQTTSTPTNFGLNPANGTFTNPSPLIAFTVDTKKGNVNFAFPASEVLKDANGNVTNEMVYSPAEINAAYNFATLNQGPPPSNTAYVPIVTIRYVWLKVPDTTYNQAGTSPLATVPNARIVAGSEQVIGPDQRPGPHYGQPILYTRVPANSSAPIGWNQYRINYTNVINMTNSSDPQQTVGYLQFDSQPDAPGVINSLPESYVDPNSGQTVPTEIQVSYQFQNNLPSDVVKADYFTRQLMRMTLGVRMFDRTNGQAEEMDLTNDIHVRNLQR